jgi:tetratricopeptide (TPR) repeat protein
VLSGYVPFISALLALLAGVAIGKAWERYKLRDGRWIDRRKARDSHHYVLGLNYLVANQIDLAIEELSQAARVDADALEIHLILGNVYRERGQVSRAIQVHQSLLQRQKLTRLEHAYVMLCLGLDYKRGGFVDRAVEAFKEARRLDPSNAYALLHLEKVYEEQRQWEDAAKVRQELLAMAGPESPARSQTILAFRATRRRSGGDGRAGPTSGPDLDATSRRRRSTPGGPRRPTAGRAPGEGVVDRVRPPLCRRLREACRASRAADLPAGRRRASATGAPACARPCPRRRGQARGARFLGRSTTARPDRA